MCQEHFSEMFVHGQCKPQVPRIHHSSVSHIVLLEAERAGTFDFA
jgi:hypothetical protein